jgi:DNA (cytosine-5)-methyltransferase 1
MWRLIGELRPRFAIIENTPGLFDRGFGQVLGGLAEIGFDAEWKVLSACQFGYPHTRERVFVVAYPNGTPESGKRRRIGSEKNGQKEPNIYPEAVEPPCLRMVARVPNRMDRLRGAGNAIVPDIAEYIGHCILASASPSSSNGEAP